MDVKVGLFAAAGALVGSAVGAKIALIVPASAINTVMLVLVPAVLIFLLLKDRILPEPSALSLKPSALWWRSLVIGAVIGTYDGFFGPGTGTFLAIAFSAFLGMGLLTASANARLANLASNAGSVAVFLAHGQVLFPIAIYTAAAGIAGNILGSTLAVKKGERVIRPLMVVVLVLLLAEVVRRRYF